MRLRAVLGARITPASTSSYKRAWTWWTAAAKFYCFDPEEPVGGQVPPHRTANSFTSFLLFLFTDWASEEGERPEGKWPRITKWSSARSYLSGVKSVMVDRGIAPSMSLLNETLERGGFARTRAAFARVYASESEGSRPVPFSIVLSIVREQYQIAGAPGADGVTVARARVTALLFALAWCAGLRPSEVAVDSEAKESEGMRGKTMLAWKNLCESAQREPSTYGSSNTGEEDQQDGEVAVLQLSLEAWKFNNGEARADRAVQAAKGTLTAPTGAGSRRLLLHIPALARLNVPSLYRKAKRAVMRLNDGTVPSSFPVSRFARESGSKGTVTQAAMRAALRRACKRDRDIAEVAESYTLHGLRKGVATAMLTLGVASENARRLLRWRDPRTMHDFYSFLTKGSAADALHRATSQDVSALDEGDVRRFKATPRN